MLKGGIVEFRIFKPGARMVTVAGDFNNWNPENDFLSKGRDGIWHMKKRLPSGSYRYRFIIDGEHRQDMYNEISSTDSAGDLCSLISVK